MKTAMAISQHLEQVYFGGNWVERNIKEELQVISLETAKAKIDGFNTIAAISYHMTYYIPKLTAYFEGKALTAKDAESCETPAFTEAKDWLDFQETILNEASQFISVVKALPDEELWKEFVKSEYGNAFSNILGMIEHLHYHLGQIVLLKRLIRQSH